MFVGNLKKREKNKKGLCIYHRLQGCSLFCYWALSANSSEFDRPENRLNFLGHGTILPKLVFRSKQLRDKKKHFVIETFSEALFHMQKGQ